MTETIFFAIFNSGYVRHDRRAYFPKEKTLKEFHDWIEEVRKEIETDQKTNVLVESIQFITHEK